MRQTNSALTVGIHHCSFCQGLSSFFSALPAPSHTKSVHSPPAVRPICPPTTAMSRFPDLQAHRCTPVPLQTLLASRPVSCVVPVWGRRQSAARLPIAPAWSLQSAASPSSSWRFPRLFFPLHSTTAFVPAGVLVAYALLFLPLPSTARLLTRSTQLGTSVSVPARYTPFSWSILHLFLPS